LKYTNADTIADSSHRKQPTCLQGVDLLFSADDFWQNLHKHKPAFPLYM